MSENKCFQGECKNKPIQFCDLNFYKVYMCNEHIGDIVKDVDESKSHKNTLKFINKKIVKLNQLQNLVLLDTKKQKTVLEDNCDKFIQKITTIVNEYTRIKEHLISKDIYKRSLDVEMDLNGLSDSDAIQEIKRIMKKHKNGLKAELEDVKSGMVAKVEEEVLQTDSSVKNYMLRNSSTRQAKTKVAPRTIRRRRSKNQMKRQKLETSSTRKITSPSFTSYYKNMYKLYFFPKVNTDNIVKKVKFAKDNDTEELKLEVSEIIHKNISMCRLSKGKILIFCYGNMVGDHEINTGISFTFDKLGKVKYRKSGEKLFMPGLIHFNGKIFAFGGLDDNNMAVTHASTLSFVRNQWKEIAHMPQPSYNISCATAGGRIYVCGYLHDKVYEYNLRLNDYIEIFTVKPNSTKVLLTEDSKLYVIESLGHIYKIDLVERQLDRQYKATNLGPSCLDDGYIFSFRILFNKICYFGVKKSFWKFDLTTKRLEKACTIEN